jgi:hypothetical protein
VAITSDGHSGYIGESRSYVGAGVDKQNVMYNSIKNENININDININKLSLEERKCILEIAETDYYNSFHNDEYEIDPPELV